MANAGSVGALFPQGIVDIANRNDPALQRNLLATKAEGITCSIPSFMMLEGDLCCQLHYWRLLDCTQVSMTENRVLLQGKNLGSVESTTFLTD